MAVQTDTGKDARFYFKEEDPQSRYPGVTTIIDTLNKPFLKRWTGNMAADLALDSIDYLQRLADRDREGAKRYVAGAAERYTDERGRIGTQAHKIFELMIRGQAVRRVHPDMVAYQRHFAEFLAVVKPQLVRAEDVAWSDTWRYAGSFDGWLILRVVVLDDGTWLLDPDNDSGQAIYVRVIADWKTSKSVWHSVVLQMSAYAHAEKVISADGVEEDMPAFDGAVVLHITPEGWNLIPVYRDKLDAAFRYFLHLRGAFDWEQNGKKGSLGKSLASSKRGLITGTERRG